MSNDDLKPKSAAKGGLSLLQLPLPNGQVLADGIQQMLKFEIVEKDDNNMPSYKNVSLYRAVTAEFVASAMFVFLACGAAVTSGFLISDSDASASDRIKGGDARLTLISLSFGVCIFVLVFTFGHISGGHINSAVTVALVITKKCTITRGGCYILAQCAGSVIGAAVLKGVLPPNMRGTLGATTVSADMDRGSAFVLEAILTSVLLFTVFSATDSSRSGNMHEALAPLAIGFTVFVCHLVGVPFTGCSINPSRSFGPAVVANIWKDHWVYWVGPCFGASVTGILYIIWFKKPEEPSPHPVAVPIQDPAHERYAYRKQADDMEDTAI